MPLEPAVKRAVAFVDGQNLFHAAKKAFGYSIPNYDPSTASRASTRDACLDPNDYFPKTSA